MTDSAATFHPIPSADRSPLAPLVPSEVTVDRGRITCVYEGQPDEVYESFKDFWRESQLSATELVGDLLDIDALRSEAARAGDIARADFGNRQRDILDWSGWVSKMEPVSASDAAATRAYLARQQMEVNARHAAARAKRASDDLVLDELGAKGLSASEAFTRATGRPVTSMVDSLAGAKIDGGMTVADAVDAVEREQAAVASLLAQISSNSRR